jgi:hypothetical protein
MHKPVIACLDLEEVLVPEIWINVALKTGIDILKITTREMPDYDALMTRRLAILDQHNYHSRYPECHRQDGPAGRGRRLCGLAPRTMPGDHLV